MRVPFVSFLPMERELDADLRAAFSRVFERSWYIGGKEDELFEKAFAEYCGTAYCVGCGNGLDALMLSLRTLGVGAEDEVIVPSNTYIATALAVTYVGATPVFVEPDICTFNIDPTKMLYIGGESIIAGTIAEKDNTLFLGNITLDRSSIPEEIKNSLTISTSPIITSTLLKSSLEIIPSWESST